MKECLRRDGSLPLSLWTRPLLQRKGGGSSRGQVRRVDDLRRRLLAHGHLEEVGPERRGEARGARGGDDHLEAGARLAHLRAGDAAHGGRGTSS